MQYHLMSDYYFMMLNQMLAFYRSIFSAEFVYALIILIVGIIFANEFGKMASGIVKNTGIENYLDKAGIKDFLKRNKIKTSISSVVGWLVKWFIILFTLNVIVEFVGLSEISNFLSSVLSYVPNLFGAVIILVFGIIIAQIVYETLEKSGVKSGLKIYHLAGVACKWIIMVITFLVMLEQIGIQTTILQIFAAGLSLMMALAGGLAFGLGGQYYARELLDEMKNKLKK